MAWVMAARWLDSFARRRRGSNLVAVLSHDEANRLIDASKGAPKPLGSASGNLRDCGSSDRRQLFLRSPATTILAEPEQVDGAPRQGSEEPLDVTGMSKPVSRSKLELIFSGIDAILDRRG
jgi:hypothetical protein